MFGEIKMYNSTVSQDIVISLFCVLLWFLFMCTYVTTECFTVDPNVHVCFCFILNRGVVLVKYWGVVLSTEGVLSGKGRHSHSPVWGSGGYAARKIYKNSTLKLNIFRHFSSSNDVFCPIKVTVCLVAIALPNVNQFSQF